MSYIKDAIIEFINKVSIKRKRRKTLIHLIFFVENRTV
jgi:hypothetical protein